MEFLSFVCLLKLSASFDCRSSHMKKLQQAYAIKFKGKFQLSVSKLASDVWWRLVVRTAFSFPPGPASRSLTETLLWHNEYKKLEISFWIEKDEKNQHMLYTECGRNSCRFPFSFCPLFLCESQHGKPCLWLEEWWTMLYGANGISTAERIKIKISQILIWFNTISRLTPNAHVQSTPWPPLALGWEQSHIQLPKPYGEAHPKSQDWKLDHTKPAAQMAGQAHDLLKKQKERTVFEDFSKTQNFIAKWGSHTKCSG